MKINNNQLIVIITSILIGSVIISAGIYFGLSNLKNEALYSNTIYSEILDNEEIIEVEDEIEQAIIETTNKIETQIPPKPVPVIVQQQQSQESDVLKIEKCKSKWLNGNAEFEEETLFKILNEANSLIPWYRENNIEYDAMERFNELLAQEANKRYQTCLNS